MPFRFPHRARAALAVFALLFVTNPTRADIDAWYELVAATGPDTVTVMQGEPGAPLVISTPPTAGIYELTIRLVADIPVEDEIVAWSIDLLAPDFTGVAVSSITYLGPFEVDWAATFGAGPGTLLDDASQFTFGPFQSGDNLALLEFVLTVERPPGDDVEIYTAIGGINWASMESPTLVRFADADPIDGEEADLISSTPSIVIIEGDAPNDPPPEDPPPDNPPPEDPPPDEPPPVNPVPQTDHSTQSDTTQQTSQTVRQFDRAQLRQCLARWFLLPIEGNESVSCLTWRTLGYPAMNLALYLGLQDLVSLPARLILFELTYAILDAALP